MDDNRYPDNMPPPEETIEGPELGNLLSGNYRGGYPLRPRDDFQDMFVNFLEKNKFSGYGHYESDGATARGGYENDVFAVCPYYWGEDDEESERPNFLYKETGLEIRWYKYPMRDAYSNVPLTAKELETILQKCEGSMQN